MKKRSHRPLALALAVAALAAAAAAQLTFDEKAEVEMVAARTAFAPGDTVEAAAEMRIEDGWHVNANPASMEYLIATELTIDLPAGATQATVRYPPGESLSFEFTDEPIAVYDGTVYLLADFDLPTDTPVGRLEVPARVRYQACDDKQCLPPITVDTPLVLTVGDGGRAVDHPAFGGDAAAASVGGDASRKVSLAIMLYFAWVGGLILNAMPCVLPVLSLKVFGLVKSADAGRRHLTVGALATTAGILMSFWALALLAIGAKAAGSAVGWGIQFQQPGFVAFLAVIVVLFSLNMWGLFEISLPGRLAQLGGKVAAKASPVTSFPASSPL